jgi:hypothetical protein
MVFLNANACNEKGNVRKEILIYFKVLFRHAVGDPGDNRDTYQYR